MSATNNSATAQRIGEALAIDRVRQHRIFARAALVAAVVVSSFYFTGLLDAARLTEGGPAIAKIGSEMLPPDFTRWREWLRPLADTLAMSVAGTAIAVGLSFPLAFFAAANTASHAGLYRAARFLLNVLRAVPELIMGIVFVAAVGFGALPGVLALGLHSVGMVGKFFAEAVEHVDPRPIEAARAAGAMELHVVFRAILPQVLPQMLDTAIYRWEYNFRASTVMGAVGAGGIGAELMGSLRLMDYPQVFAILLCVLACVTAVDAVGGLLRRRLA